MPARFDTIVLDPPAFAKNKASVQKALSGYKEINLRALKLLTPGGFLVTCSCSYNVSEADFADVLRVAAAVDARADVSVVEKRTQGPRSPDPDHDPGDLLPEVLHPAEAVTRAAPPRRRIRWLVVAVALAAAIVWQAPRLRRAAAHAGTGVARSLHRDDLRPARAWHLPDGHAAGRGQREAQEVPHTVTLSPFYLSRYEVTQAEWQRVMGHNPSQFQDCGPRCPVENVNWFEVQQFIRRLDAESQPGFRLPTEAEWEFACRAGGGCRSAPLTHCRRPTPTSTATFRTAAPRLAARQARRRWGSSPRTRGGSTTCPATSGSGWRTGPARTLTDDQSNPVGRCGSDTRVIRGGSWLFDGASARCGLRYTHRPQDRGYSLGVRLAHDL